MADRRAGPKAKAASGVIKPAGAEASLAGPSSRQRMVQAAAALLSEKGLDGASFSEVIERSGAPRGSIYHHFPAGKDALTAEAVQLVGDQVLGLLRASDAKTPAQVVGRFVAAWRQVLSRSDCQAGCAIAAVANESLSHPGLASIAAGVFSAWEKELLARLVASGLPKPKAAAAAPLILAAVEGALVLCRARQELGPIDAVGKALEAYVSG